MTYIFDFGDFYEDNITFNSTFTPDGTTDLCTSTLSHIVARLLGITYIFIFLMAISGNLLVGLVIGVNRRALTPSDVYLFNLTIADFLLALTLPFWASKNWLQSWVFGDFMCKIINLITDANFYTSILFLVCISIDRYLAIVCTPRSHRDRQQYCSWFACASIWVIGVALALPALFKESFELSGPDHLACAEPLDSSSKWKLVTRVVGHVLGFLLPLVVMVTCYGITISRLLRTRGFKKHRAMRVIVMVVVAFLLCWLPYHLALIIETATRLKLLAFDCPGRRAVDAAELVTKSLALSHCCINPLLYAMVGERFWVNLQKLKFPGDVTSRSSFSRSTSQTSEGNAMIS